MQRLAKRMTGACVFRATHADNKDARDHIAGVFGGQWRQLMPVRPGYQFDPVNDAEPGAVGGVVAGEPSDRYEAYMLRANAGMVEPEVL